MGWRTRDKQAREQKHDSMEAHLREARRLHAARIRVQFPNWEEVIHDAKEVVRVYEAEMNLPLGTYDVAFDEHGLNEGYFLVVPSRADAMHEETLLERIRERTGETFDVDRSASI